MGRPARRPTGGNVVDFIPALVQTFLWKEITLGNSKGAAINKRKYGMKKGAGPKGHYVTPGSQKLDRGIPAMRAIPESLVESERERQWEKPWSIAGEWCSTLSQAT